jgi:hypothetical protein
MFFYKEYTFTSAYAKEELLQQVKQMRKSSDKRIWQFDGTIQKDTFTISPIFYSGHEYRQRPELYGTIVQGPAACTLFLQVRISSAFKILLYVMLILNSLIWLYIVYDRKNIPLEFFDWRILYPMGGLIFLIMLLVDFYQSGNRAVNILIDKLKLQNV